MVFITIRFSSGFSHLLNKERYDYIGGMIIGKELNDVKLLFKNYLWKLIGMEFSN